MPGTIRWTLAPGQTVHFACSTDPIDLSRLVTSTKQLPKRTTAITGAAADTTLDTLLAAADQFVVTGERGTQILTGYPWAPQAGRDSLISFCGLLLVTGRLAEAKSLLQLFATSESAGLMPSEFPSDGADPKYTGADVSLWFINAVWHYLRYGGDSAVAHGQLLPVIDSILRHYQTGTLLGIQVDTDGLLASREPGVPVTWMDAKVGDWVITPRHGRAVEVNALWYNAQRIGAILMRASGQDERATELATNADTTKSGFNRLFWNESLRCCFDVIDGESTDASIRPNQLLAVSLPFPVLSADRHHLVLDKIRRELLTPVGMRTLSTDDPNYAGRYFGAVTTRDRAYHQGSVFPWLLGPYVATVVRTRGRSLLVREEARAILQSCLDHLTTNGLGQLCGLFDGDAPHHPGGLPASARSVAEVLRAYVEDVLDLAPRSFELRLPHSRTISSTKSSDAHRIAD